MRQYFVVTSIIVVVAVVLLCLVFPAALWLLVPVGALVGIGIYDMTQTRHSLRRNFPLVGRGRWMLEAVRPFIRQYLLESDTDGTPVPRMFRSVDRKSVV